MKCKWYLCKKNARESSPFCSKSCGSKAATTRRRQELKRLAVEYKGGKCERCGYNKSVRALQFHHPDPTIKEFSVGNSGHTRSWERTKTEVSKCELLCANCHAEHHEKEYLNSVGDSLEKSYKPIKGRPHCAGCDKELDYGSVNCLECFNKSQEKIDWPVDEILKIKVGEIGYKTVAKELGVSYSTLWKRINNPRPTRVISSALS